MGKRGTLILLAVALVVGLASFALALLEPSHVGPWATAFGMSCMAVAQVIRLRELNKRGTCAPR